jgi:hypothetical protein
MGLSSTRPGKEDKVRFGWQPVLPALDIACGAEELRQAPRKASLGKPKCTDQLMTGVSFRAQSINWIDPAGAPGWQPASYERDGDQENRRAKHG